MKSKLFFIISALLFSGCAISQPAPTTSTVITTTTIDLGSDCNAVQYKKYIDIVYNELENLYKYTGDTKLLKSSNMSKAIEYLNSIKFTLNYIDLPTINSTRLELIQSIDDYIEDINYYFAYKANSRSVAEVNISQDKFDFLFNKYDYEYKELCSSRSST